MSGKELFPCSGTEDHPHPEIFYKAYVRGECPACEDNAGLRDDAEYWEREYQDADKEHDKLHTAVSDALGAATEGLWEQEDGALDRLRELVKALDELV